MEKMSDQFSRIFGNKCSLYKANFEDEQQTIGDHKSSLFTHCAQVSLNYESIFEIDYRCLQKYLCQLKYEFVNYKTKVFTNENFKYWS